MSHKLCLKYTQLHPDNVVKLFSKTDVGCSWRRELCVNMCVDIYIFANVYVSWCVTGLIKPNTTNCEGGFMIG